MIAAAANKLVSIIIPSYNHAQYVGAAIQSVLDQTYDSVEIIVVDDGSTDNTRQVVGDFGEAVRYIWQENQGLSAARNTGICAARGELIGVLDADDLYEPEFVATLTAVVQTDPDAAAVYCAYQYVDADNAPLPQQASRTVPPDQLHEALLGGNFLVPLCLLVRKSAYEQAGVFDKNFQGCADWDMWLRLALKYKIVGIDRSLVRYRALPNSMSSDPAYMLADRLRVLQKHLPLEASQLSEQDTRRQKAYGHTYLIAAVEYLQKRDTDRAYDCLRDMVRVGPLMLTRLETFYELALGDQPKGYRGHFASLNLNWSNETTTTLLSRLFTEEPTAASYRQIAYARFHYALALLHYGARQPAQARRHLWLSFSHRPRQAIDRHWQAMLLRVLFPGRLAKALRTTKSVRS
jgi:glycosyltransferase involved in cell wall biosynthesis